MKQPKTLPTRKKAALRRIIRLAVILVLAWQFFHVGLVLPVQGIYGAVERGGATGTRVSAREWNPDFRVTQLFYLTGSEEATVLADTSLGLFGWESGFECTLDCTEGAPLYAGERSMTRQDRDQRLHFYFGRVDDPEIASVAVSIQMETYENGQMQRREIERLEVPELLERNGYRYFWVHRLREVQEDSDGIVRAAVITRDSSGREIGQLEIQQGSYSSYG